ncbi:MAG: BON domain-containing protein [Candidatus Acidiferrales bacterium]
MKTRFALRWLSTASLALAFLSGPAFGHSNKQQSSPDNTRINKEERVPTADEQGMSASDRGITQKSRKAIHEDKNFSTYAHNIKIITRNGEVILRGPVRSEDEKTELQAESGRNSWSQQRGK